MRKILTCVFWVAVFGLFAHFAMAEEAATTADTADKVQPVAETVSSLAEDIKKARDLMMGSAGDNPFARGLLVAMFQPIFLLSMFSLGLFSGQMSERISKISMLPIFAFGATVIGAFITAYHSDWKPALESDHYKFVSMLQTTDAVAVVAGLMIGAVVAMQMAVAPFVAFAGVVVAGLALGFSQTAELGEHHNSLLPFWAGFGLTGLLVNIFGIGFETFFQSINLTMVTRCVGFATALLSLVVGTKIF